MFIRKQKNQRGFTLIELLIIITVIIILASVIVASLYRARVRSNATSVMYSLKSAATASYGCLLGGLQDARLSNVGDASHSSVCVYNSGGTYVDDPSYTDWPDLTKKSWNVTQRTNLAEGDGAYWCRLGSAGATHPIDVGAYDNNIYGGNNISGEFCFMLKNSGMYVWCRPDGCRREGF